MDMSTKRLLILNVIILLVLVGGGFGGYAYYNNAVNYLTTDNAQISGQQITIAAAANGKLINWEGNQGTHYAKDDTVGTIAETGADGKPVQVNVAMPTDGTIVQNNSVQNAFVAAGTPLAEAYDLNNLWVTANINETNIDQVAVNQDVDIYVDAFPNTPLKGKVEKIGLATAGTFSILPSSNTNANFTKVTQVIPVQVSIDDSKGLEIVPGMNVTVKIHK